MAITINWNGETSGLTDYYNVFRVDNRSFTLEELEGASLQLSNGEVIDNLIFTDGSNTFDNQEAGTVFVTEQTILSDNKGGSWSVFVCTKDFNAYNYFDYKIGVYFPKVNGVYVSKLTLPNAEEITKSLAEITYNGETIAQLNAGETATLSCEGKKMASDVVVKVNEVESKIPEGYVKPEGTLELVFNNIEAEFPIDCSQYAKVTVNTAEPLKITDPTVLDNITDSPYGVGGSVFLYEGATTDSYEKGALYYLEDTDK